ncbi:hypothetical protein [Nocardioides sp. 503]|uniref:hypothetical protein n=1 Tax=Nocardioides sp. 503 TaxID=2508326 RepID=UPI00107021FF|nr:hypothetical protein [Nocardioides sp. 503]
MGRYEMSSRGPGIEEGLASRLHDPLWLLGRQWQFGEFRHENQPSPAWVEVDVDAHPLDEWRPAAREEWLGLDLGAAPLERMVEEHEAGVPPRLRFDGGVRWRRALASAGRADDLAAYVGRCGFPDHALASAADAALRTRVPDGSRLADSLAALTTEDQREAELTALREHGEVTATPTELEQLATDWLTWWSRRASPLVAPDDAWDEHRFEHRFAVRASTLPEVELHADEYVGGRLDWSSFDAVGVADGAATQAPITVRESALPSPARFGGMPAPRLWEMEDARFDPGAVDAAPIDLGRLMLSGYATVYGNDWFVVPLRLPVGTLSRVTRFVVRDVFGGTTELSAVAADQDGWNLFSLTQADAPLEPDQERPTSPWFLLAPAVPHSLESRPTDVVMLLRDEMANVAWAVEGVIEDDHGKPLDRFAAWAARETQAIPEITRPTYRVDSEVPDHWFPLLPEQLADLESVRLRLAPITRLVDGVPASPEPRGGLLPSVGSWLHEEEVPRSGVQVVRTWQHARWQGGSRHLWRGRHKLTGHGEGDSGLRFDEVEWP